MFGRLMNSYYYGKSGKGDFRKEDMPTNRWQLFWEMLRIRFSGLIRLNLMYVVVWLPTILLLFSTALNWYSSLGALFEAQEAGTLTAEMSAQFDGLQATLLFRMVVFLIPCLLITGPVSCGVAYVTRNWARDEHAFIWSDFKDAIKENWKQGLGISAITSVAPVILYICWNFYGDMASQSVFFVVPQMLSLILCALWAMSLMYMYPLIVAYKLRFRDLLRNGLLLTIARLPQTVGLKLLSLVPAAICFVLVWFGLTQWALLAIFAYYLVIGLSLSRFVGASYANGVFDKFINSRIEGAVVNRGLNTEDLDDDEDDDANADGANDEPANLDAGSDAANTQDGGTLNG